MLGAWWLYSQIAGERHATACKKGGVPFMERLFKDWLVANWTKNSGRPDDGTLLPAGTTASDVVTVGYTSIYYPDGIVFYSRAGNAAFHVQFDRHCGFRIIERQWCPNMACSLVSRASH